MSLDLVLFVINNDRSCYRYQRVALAQSSTVRLRCSADLAVSHAGGIFVNVSYRLSFRRANKCARNNLQLMVREEKKGGSLPPFS